jgi:hypothetical protein
MTGLLIFLGLLGTFWGLIETVGSVGKVLEGLNVGGDAGSVFDTLKEGLAAPLSGMGISFSSSLFGLAGSLVLGFLDLQMSQAQNRFHTDLEDWLATTVRDLGGDPVAPVAGVAAGPNVSGEIRVAIERLREAKYASRCRSGSKARKPCPVRSPRRCRALRRGPCSGRARLRSQRDRREAARSALRARACRFAPATAGR